MLFDKITLYAVGYSGIGGAAVAVKLEYTDRFMRQFSRFITHFLGEADEETANIRAARMALASVIRPMRKIAKIKLVVPKHVAVVLDSSNPNYLDYPIQNAEDSLELRRLITFFDALLVSYVDRNSIDGVSDAQRCVESKSGSDSGTRRV